MKQMRNLRLWLLVMTGALCLVSTVVVFRAEPGVDVVPTQIPDGMVYIPAGEFLMGSDAPDAELDEKPLRRIYVEAFYIDRYEVTNRQFKTVFPEHSYPEGQENYPATHVTKAQAMAYCRKVGKCLPTNAEWEKAARGTDGRLFPWGNEPDRSKANVHGTDTGGGMQPVGSFPEGAGPYGVQDMVGNAWEWVLDIYDSSNILNRSIPRGILRGGAHGYGWHQARCSYQGFEDLNSTCNDTGFRCAMDVE